MAIAVRDLERGAEIALRQDMPQAHKIALTDIPKGGEVICYGVVLGTMKEDMPQGGWIHSTNLPMTPRRI